MSEILSNFDESTIRKISSLFSTISFFSSYSSTDEFVAHLAMEIPVAAIKALLIL